MLNLEGVLRNFLGKVSVKLNLQILKLILTEARPFQAEEKHE